MKKEILFSTLLFVVSVSFLGCELGSPEEISDPELEAFAASQDQSVNKSAPTSSSGDGGLPAGVQWIFGSDISNWPITMNASNARIERVSGHEPWEVFLSYDRLQDIPRYYVAGDPNNVHNVNGSIWLIREFEGQWYAGTIDYLRVGQMSKRFNTSASYKLTPQSGDRIGVLVSTMNRSYNGTVVQGDPNSPYRERSNVTWTTWP